MRKRSRIVCCGLAALLVVGFSMAQAQEPAQAQKLPVTDPATRAFEEGRWTDAIDENRLILEANPDDRIALLRIAQSQTELGRYEEALRTLEHAGDVYPEMPLIDAERARNLMALGRVEPAFEALLDADHKGLRAYGLLADSPEFASIRDEGRFVELLTRVRNRVRPCDAIAETHELDFWLGHWEVRTPEGALAGVSTVTKEEGGCAVVERWEATGGGTGRSTSFYLPSRKQWRNVWVGSAGTYIDMVGQLRDGEMHMEGTIEYPHLDRVAAFRATWSQGAGGLVRQKMEEFNDATGVWSIWFDGIYRPKD